jgi:hypothetical protein
VAPYDYVFVWDEDLGVDNFTADAYVLLVIHMPPMLSPSSTYLSSVVMDDEVQVVHGCRYLDIVRKHGLEISQPGLDATNVAPMYDVTAKKNSSEMHK